eukprot:TRINITY_DN12309_c0_g1_i1.p1 TRINITY_DN12309_c0_g1~~TRINITY_DN12309_c0_g1_i1.p1  ORF type:complete len:164 (-),score=30.14 TRINITY_DN12309_c0_g1_i1:108-599(-)
MSKGLYAVRIGKEISNMNNDEEVILYLPDEDNILHWKAYIRGPPDTPYEGAYFLLDIQCSSSYPHRAPTVLFETKIFHPNIHFTKGEICLDILKDAWTPGYTLEAVCRSIITLLGHPEAESPLNCDCGNIIRHGDIDGYVAMARLYSRLYASYQIPDTENNFI